MSIQLTLFPKKKDFTKGLLLFFDGAARNNPGPGGAGIVIKRDNNILHKSGFFLGNQTNNQAEYLALILGLIIIQQYKNEKEPIKIYGDSELLIKQMQGSYRIKNPQLQKLAHIAQILSSKNPTIFKHIPRKDNQEADAMANQGIDTKHHIPEVYQKGLREYHIEI